MTTTTLYADICAQIAAIEVIAQRSLPWDRARLRRIAAALRQAAIEARAIERTLDELVDMAREEEAAARQAQAERHRASNVIPLRRRHRSNPDFTPPSAA